MAQSECTYRPFSVVMFMLSFSGRLGGVWSPATAALAIGFEDVHPVGQAVQQGSDLAEGHIAHFLEDQQAVAILALFKQLGDQADDIVEAGSLARWVLPVPGLPTNRMNRMFSRAPRYSPHISSRTNPSLRKGWALKSKLSGVLLTGNFAAFHRRSAARCSRSISSFHVNYKGTGSKQLPPHTMLAPLVFCYSCGVFSFHRIERATDRDIAVRYLCGYTHIDQTPSVPFAARTWPPSISRRANGTPSQSGSKAT